MHSKKNKAPERSNDKFGRRGREVCKKLEEAPTSELLSFSVPHIDFGKPTQEETCVLTKKIAEIADLSAAKVCVFLVESADDGSLCYYWDELTTGELTEQPSSKTVVAFLTMNGSVPGRRILEISATDVDDDDVLISTQLGTYFEIDPP